MKVKKLENFWNKISLAGGKRSRLSAPGTGTPVSHSLLEESHFSFPAPLSGVIDNWTPQYESQEVGKCMEQNQLNRLQMVQFECPKYRNPCISFTFAFPAIGPDCISCLPRFTSVLGNGHTMLKTLITEVKRHWARLVLGWDTENG